MTWRSRRERAGVSAVGIMRVREKGNCAEKSTVLNFQQEMRFVKGQITGNRTSDEMKANYGKLAIPDSQQVWNRKGTTWCCSIEGLEIRDDGLTLPLQKRG